MILAKAAEVKVRAYIGCVVGCPYEGAVNPRSVANVSTSANSVKYRLFIYLLKIAKTLIDFGCYEISLGDTTGVGTPGSMTSMLTAVLQDVHANFLALHCHDTYGQALVNILASLEVNVIH